jgi:nucleoside-diphosphate-sugar epimerase
MVSHITVTKLNERFVKRELTGCGEHHRPRHMKVLVTGSEGYIGSVMVPMLLEEGMEVVGLDVSLYAEGNLDNSTFPSYPLIAKDVRDVEKADIAGQGIDAIVHLAALSNDPLGELDPVLTMAINHRASVRLAEIAKSCRIERFVFASSCSLYGQGASKALTEEDPANPQTPYGKSKTLTEQDLLALAGPGFAPTFMRNATAHGFSPRQRFDLVVNSLTGYAVVDSEIKILGDGKPWRPLVHIGDISGAVIAVLKADRDRVASQAFNVGDNQENYQIKSIAENIKEFYPACQISIAQKDSGDTRDYNVAFDKLNSHLDYRAKWSLPSSIKELKGKYDEVGLNRELFESRLYTRLSQIRYLMQEKIIDESLRRI